MNVLLPVMAKDVLHAGAKGFGLLATAISVGMLVGGLLTASVKRVSRPGLGIIWGVVTIGGALLLFSLSRHMILSMGTLVIVGAAAALTNVLSVVIFQTHAPNEMQGRVFAADQAVSSSLEPIALATIGGLLTLFTAPLLILAGGVAVGIAGLSGYFIPGMRKL
jgi:MFS family permease